MKLSFMTFVCPTWEIERAVAFAAKAGYDGVEIRVDEGHKHGISSQSPNVERQRVRRLFGDAGVEVACVATSVKFAFSDPVAHAENVAAAKANLELAADLGAPIVRMFAGGSIPKLTPAAAEQIAVTFDEVGAYSTTLGVCPMLECGHDIIIGAAEATDVIKRVTTRNFGVLWNYSTMDDTTFEALKDRIRHFHVHDEVLEPANKDILTLAKRMKTIGYAGYLSLEIIRGADLPEDLLASTAKRLKGYMQQV